MNATSEQLAKVDEAVDLVRPEAADFVKALDLDHMRTTKDNYGRVMSMLSKLEVQTAILFLIAMVGEGYPLVTATQLSHIMGWPSQIDDLLSREYLKS